MRDCRALYQDKWICGYPQVLDGQIYINSCLVDQIYENTLLVDLNGKPIYEGDIVAPVYIGPDGDWGERINFDLMGSVKYECGSFKVFPPHGKSYNLRDYVNEKFIEYRENVGEIYGPENNIFLGVNING